MIQIQQAETALKRLFPLELAAEWDNVGLLIHGTRQITNVLLCIDVTEAVVAEAMRRSTDLLVAYHPPIFRGLKRLTRATASERVVAQLVRSGVSVYSPHTALDAAAPGLNDWLIGGLGILEQVQPILPAPSNQAVGQGRWGRLAEPAPLSVLIDRIKSHLGLTRVRVATPNDELLVNAVAVCAGSGGSVLAQAPPAELILTGELGHHQVLAHLQAGQAVVLTEHSHSERGYLPRLAMRIRQALPTVRCELSSADFEALRVV